MPEKRVYIARIKTDVPRSTIAKVLRVYDPTVRIVAENDYDPLKQPSGIHQITEPDPFEPL